MLIVIMLNVVAPFWQDTSVICLWLMAYFKFVQWFKWKLSITILVTKKFKSSWGAARPCGDGGGDDAVPEGVEDFEEHAGTAAGWPGYLAERVRYQGSPS
jgi:hypothetical protein